MYLIFHGRLGRQGVAAFRELRLRCYELEPDQASSNKSLCAVLNVVASFIHGHRKLYAQFILWGRCGRFRRER